MPNDLKNDLDTKDSINNTFISNQLNKTNNIELLKALENGFKLIDLSDDEINIIISGIQNNEIKPLVFGSNAFTDDSISNEKFTLEVIDLSLLNDEFILDNSFLMPLIIQII